MWSKLTWIKHEHDFMFHHLREQWNQWMTIFPFFLDFEWKSGKSLRDFTWNCKNYGNWAWAGFHILELKWNVIWSAWIFRKREFTEPITSNCYFKWFFIHLAHPIIHANLAPFFIGLLLLNKDKSFVFVCDEELPTLLLSIKPYFFQMGGEMEK